MTVGQDSLFPTLHTRALPSNSQAEQALLGALLANNKAVDRVADFLRPHHFADALHGRIYGAILERVMRGAVADAVTLRVVFEHDSEMIAAGGVKYLAELLVAMVGIINAGEYGQTIRDAWTRREVIGLCTDAVNAAFAGTAMSEVMETLDAGMLRVVEGAGDEQPVVSLGEGVAQQVAATRAARERESALAGLTTGYAALDRMTLGLQPGKLMLIGARPSMGKTALGLGIAVRAAMAGAHGLFWSGEMSAQQLGARAAAAYTGLPTTSVFSARRWDVPGDARPSRKLDEFEMRALAEAEDAARSLPLVFDTRPGVTVQALRARARRLKRAGRLHFMVLDYVGLLRTHAVPPARGLYEKMTAISAELMELKGELDIPIIALVQLNRANEAREDKTPSLGDLRDSGALEQDADVVMLLHRPHYYLTRGEPQRRGNETDEHFANRCSRHALDVETEAGRATVLVVKNRQGPTGPTRLLFDDPTTWFRDESEGPDTPAWMGVLT